MTYLTRFEQYLRLADQLVNVASKDDIAECARLLAINLAHYEMKFGPLPLDETLAAMYSDEPNDEQIQMLTRGLENMVGVLGGIVEGFEDKTQH